MINHQDRFAIIKLLPFDGVVGENGALLSFWPNRRKGRVEREEPVKRFWTPTGYGVEPPAGLQDRVTATAEAILREVPRARIASDQRFRMYDLAIDFAEEVDPPLNKAVQKGARDLNPPEAAKASDGNFHFIFQARSWVQMVPNPRTFSTERR